jgi:autotransporter-associated beta strand protein
VLTVGADGSSSTFDGSIVESGWALAGSWTPYGGPSWTTGTAPTLSATEAAALLFGGSAIDYRISSVSNQVADIDDMAWYDVYAIGRSLFSSTYKVDGNGDGFYNQPGDTSAYVSDNFVNDTNYAFTLTSGIGGLTKVGAGTLTLNGINDWSGTTTVSGGALIGNTSSISGSTIVNDASLVYDQDFDGTVSQSITGTGSLTKLGTGTVTLSGVTDYSGDTLVQEGTLALSGSVASLGSSRVVVDGTLDVSQTLSAGVNTVDKVDSFYGTYLASTTAGVASTLNWQAAGYFINGVFAFTDASGTITSVVRTTNDNYTFYNVLSGDALIGTQCVADASTACLVATGSPQSLIPALSAMNGGQGLFDGSAFRRDHCRQLRPAGSALPRRIGHSQSRQRAAGHQRCRRHVRRHDQRDWRDRGARRRPGPVRGQHLFGRNHRQWRYRPRPQYAGIRYRDDYPARSDCAVRRFRDLCQ